MFYLYLWFSSNQDFFFCLFVFGVTTDNTERILEEVEGTRLEELESTWEMRVGEWESAVALKVGNPDDDREGS